MTEVFALPVVSIIATHSEHQDKILLQRRIKKTPQKRFYGLWELPQGKIRSGESIFSAARRELHEETGLQALALAPQHRCTTTDNSDNLEVFHPLNCVFDLSCQCIGLAVIVTTAGTPADSSEAADHRWLTQQQITELIAKEQIFPLNIPMIKQYFNQ
ncbi:MAG: NUDIX hydrolase [Desulfuromonas sp.]|nr:NUDIX hydrolase [Desulfuromonas sp.]